MAAVAIRTGSRILSRENGAAVNTLQVLFDGMENGNLVTGEKPGIRVATSTSRRLISLGHRRSDFTSGLNLVDGPVAGSTSGSIGIAGLGGAAVNAIRKILDFRGVAFGASCGLDFGCRTYFMYVAVARRASRFAKQ